MRLVIIESPYGSDDENVIAENVIFARRCVGDCLHRGESPIASHLLFTQPGILRDDVPEERALGMKAAREWFKVADAVVFYMDRGMSPGMQRATDEAKLLGVPTEERWLQPETVLSEAD